MYFYTFIIIIIILEDRKKTRFHFLIIFQNFLFSIALKRQIKNNTRGQIKSISDKNERKYNLSNMPEKCLEVNKEKKFAK